MDKRTQRILDRIPKKTSIKTFSQAFEHALTQQWDPKTANGMNVIRHAKQFEEIAGDPALTIINTPFIKAVVQDAVDSYSWSNGSANRFISTISMVLKIAARDGYINAIPVIQRYKEGEGRTNWFTKEQVTLLTNLACERGDFELADLIRAAVYTGARQAELRKLKVRDVDFRPQQPVIHIGGTPDSVTKAKNYRQVGINDKIVEMLQRRLHGKDAMDLVFGEVWYSRQIINRHFNKVRDKAIRLDPYIDESYVFHTLRHTFGTWQIAAGAPLMHVKAAMGHKRVETTERYVHNTQDAVLSTANNI
jgi:integrase